MSKMTLIWIGIFIGSTIGGYIPVIFGASLFSYSSLFGNAIGSVAGWWVVWKFF